MLDAAGTDAKARIDSPSEFEENVLLTFDNAMTYNPPTHDGCQTLRCFCTCGVCACACARVRECEGWG